MHNFNYKNNRLYCEKVPIEEIAKEVGTPFYTYSSATLTRHFKAFNGAFNASPHITCFATKA